jgi:type III secretion protein L
MTVARARVIKASASAGASAGPNPDATRDTHMTERLARRLPRVVVDATADAARILADARAAAESIVAEARGTAAAVAESAAREARDAELAKIAAEVVLARASEERRAERELDRTIELAVLLAERLVGEALAVDPARASTLAVDALRETRGARQLRIEAAPADVPALTDLIASLGEGVATIEASSELGRGSLIVHTELGRVDARLAPQLARLAEALREALGEARRQESAPA